MLRAILGGALGLFVAIAALERHMQGAEPRSKEAEGKIKARELVFRALEAESGGDNERRSELLGEARSVWPELAEANWHLGRVNEFGGWLPIEEAVAAATANTNLTKYDELREKAASARELRELARWCQKNGYADRARLHYAQVLAHAGATADQKADAVKELDLQKVGDAWLTREELSARAAEIKRTEAAVATWRPRLARLQALIDGDDFKRRDGAIAEFHAIDDPAIILVLPLVLAEAGSRFQEESVQRLAAFAQYEATVALVKIAVLSDYGFVRTAAAKALKKRPLHEYAPLLLGGLTAPIKTQYQIQWDPRGRISYTHAFLREGPSGNLLLMAHGLAVPQQRSSRTYKDNTVRVYAPEVPKSAKVTTVVGRTAGQALVDQLQGARATADIAEMQAQGFNTLVAEQNSRIFAVLEQSTNEQLPHEPLAWWTWWQDYNQYQWPRPTQYVYQSSAQQYYFGFSQHTQNIGTRGYSCFVAGTVVQTETGVRSIETIRAGDRVLTQNPDTGELAYKVVLTTTLRPPTQTLRVTAGGESITTTLGHPFWVNGPGWRMAKELAAGDLLHTLKGVVKVEKVEPAPDAPAYNLVVDDFNTYFVGNQGLLVHDNNFRRPTRAVVPGLVRN